MKNVYLVGPVRTPSGRSGGSIALRTAAGMGVEVARECYLSSQRFLDDA